MCGVCVLMYLGNHFCVYYWWLGLIWLVFGFGGWCDLVVWCGLLILIVFWFVGLMGLVCLGCDLVLGLGCLLVIGLWLVVLSGCVVFGWFWVVLLVWVGALGFAVCFVLGCFLRRLNLGFGVCGLCLFLVLLVLFEVGWVLFDGLLW